MNQKNIGLVVEGGGMRGAYAAGVLEAFLDNGIEFPYAIGVSAGANTLCSFLAKQKGRNERIYTEWITDKRFIGVKNLLTEKAYFGMNFLFSDLPVTLDPFDFDTFKKTATTFKVGVTNCNTGQIEFLQPTHCEKPTDANNILRASSSLPLVAPPVEINGQHYLDGGLSNSIPVDQAMRDGHIYNVIVLTRNIGYQKTYSKKVHQLSRYSLKKYPAIINCIANRYKHYNRSLELISLLEKEGKAFVIRPKEPLQVDRFEKSPDKLKLLYKQGYDETIARLDALKQWASQINN